MVTKLESLNLNKKRKKKKGSESRAARATSVREQSMVNKLTSDQKKREDDQGLGGQPVNI